MPRSREAANNSRAAKVATIRTATAPAGVLNQVNVPDRAASRLSTTEIFLIRRVVLDQHAAIDVERYAGDHARRVTREEQDGIRDILGLAHTAERDLARPRGFALIGRDRPPKARRGRTRADRVDPDPVRGELVGGVAR